MSANQDRSSIQRPFWVVSAPSGTGKTTLITRLRARYPQVGRVVTATSRLPRAGELDGDAYYFLSREEFEAGIARGEFLEWKQLFGYYYGLPAWAIARCPASCPVIILDVEGACEVRRRFPEWCRTLFLLPPSKEVALQRMLGRGECDLQERVLRQARMEQELLFAPRFDYRVLNEDLEQAVAEAAACMGLCS